MNTKSYNKDVEQIPQGLSLNATSSRELLWQELSGKKMMGYPFHYQKPLKGYIVDFYSHELKLIIEIEGGSDAESKTDADDQTRQRKLELTRYEILKFDDTDVKTSMEFVLKVIENYIIGFEEEKIRIQSQ
ncbi:endonuclease domain-containing protein [Reichenbachiella versicolor]|uniref:endonuclease domain-containing protein n=1 Tax=Reichenbachiella versicolor TaxID=1821036 RepID=UPI000D6DC764|nr:endonuclease domain-containing protein [Reichenbachiella versicolor]